MAFPDETTSEDNNGRTSSSSLMDLSGFFYENLQPQTTDIFASKSRLSDDEGTDTKAETMIGYADNNSDEGNMDKMNDKNEGGITLMGAVQTMDASMNKLCEGITMMGLEVDISQ